MANEKEEKDSKKTTEKSEKKNLEKDEKKSKKLNKKSKKDELAKIKEDLEKKEEELADCKSLTLRQQADFENYKKFSEKQKSELIKYANEELITNLLDCYEDLERVTENSQTEEDAIEATKLIYKKMTKVLEKEGLKVILAKGEKFDPYKHEALLVTDSDEYENNEIIDELMKGYTLKDKVIKYSKVNVCKK
ncbi:nucleotide exchange factor GrpE [Methanobrevibacter sp. UBA412]|jgi:molecular chaperone GrpE|uniref:nucleotide exchange factor GrpE n=1 Tax=Methanobrevibacter sp. UBA412 TaxID=1915486 RepID=UPI0039B9923E